MENSFNNKDFEQFVKHNADQYRMFPSEKVWQGIHTALHTRRRWYGIGLALLLLTAGTVTWVMLSPSSTKQTAPGKPAIISKTDNTNLISRQTLTSGISFQSPLKDGFVPVTNTVQPRNQPVLVAAGKLTDETLSMPVFQNETTTGIPVITDQDKEQNTYKGPVAISITDQATDNNTDIAGLDKTKQEISEKAEFYPLSIESVINSFKRSAKKDKFSLQLYFTPTVSYRKLSGNKSYIQSSQSASAPYSIAPLYDVNNMVTSKPDMGLELGISAGYQLTKNLKVKAGLQFNVSRYDIKAFKYGEVATISLNRGTDSISTWTNYRNFDGYKSDWLQNLYFSVSAPVGAELRLAGDNKTDFGIAGTLQPTYILGSRAYLITDDYKNYALVPWLTRRWNVTTSIETYVSYSTGKLKWQIGPQVRYQLLSSFQSKYPVRENIFDFGLKLGIMLNK
jgi:hypothetical protein